MQEKETQAEAPDDDAIAIAFGVRIRKHRSAAGLTLEQLSRQSGVSRAMLSKVERGEKTPTIGIATRIAQALNTPLSALIGGDLTGGSPVVLRKSDRPIFRDPQTGFERHIVSPATGGSHVELVYHYLPPGVSTGLLPAYPAGTEKQVVVTTGNLVVVFEHGKQHLGPGDALFFQANVDHAFENTTSAPCGYYLVVSRQP